MSTDNDILKKALEEHKVSVLESIEKSNLSSNTVHELTLIASDALARLEKVENLEIDGARSITILAAISDAVVVINSESNIIIVNEKAEQLFGYGKNEMLGQPVIILIPHKYKEAHMAKQESYFQNPGTRLYRELQGSRKDGSLFPIEIALQPLSSIYKGRVETIVMAILREIKA